MESIHKYSLYPYTYTVSCKARDDEIGTYC